MSRETPSVVIGPARPEELEAAFRLVFRHFPPEDAAPRIVNALNLTRLGELDPAGVLVARGTQGLCGVMVCHLSPGGGGLVWPPQVVATADRVGIEDQLVDRALGWLRDQGAKLAQSLLEPEDAPLAEPLLRHGFEHITDLRYMRHKLSRLPRETSRSGRLAFQTYRQCDPLVFQETLLRTYEATLDCPEVNGVRTVEEILIGHQAQGRYDPDRWWLVWADGRPVGVVVVAEVPDWHGWDLAYLGVVPEARRRGVGREMTVRVLRAAWQAKQLQVTLAVDARNLPAWKLYRNLGFESYDRRRVYLLVWRSAPDQR